MSDYRICRDHKVFVEHIVRTAAQRPVAKRNRIPVQRERIAGNILEKVEGSGRRARPPWLRARKEEALLKNYIVVSFEARRRTVEGIRILPWKDFIERLWDGEFV